MSAKVVPTARNRPGKCVLSGDNRGPFLDTGKTVTRYGRIYIGLYALDEPLRELGWLKGEQVEELQKENQRLKAHIEALEAVKADYDTLIETLTPYLPKPPPEKVILKEKVTREPTDNDIIEFIRRHGKDHPVIKAAGSLEKGSTEEWNKLYREPVTGELKKSSEPEVEKVQEEEEEIIVLEEGPLKIYNLKDQEVDIEALLKENAKTVADFCEDQPEEFIEAVVRYEWYMTEQKDKQPRKSLMKALGYWDDEDDEPLAPADEEENE